MEMGFNNPFQTGFLNAELITQYLDANFGGIRIEDDLIVTETGMEIISLVPKSVEAIEAIMN
jgi:Xaa-Pro dipeptidase